METGQDAALGYEKNRKDDFVTDNKRNGHSSKILKTSTKTAALSELETIKEK